MGAYDTFEELKVGTIIRYYGWKFNGVFEDDSELFMISEIISDDRYPYRIIELPTRKDRGNWWFHKYMFKVLTKDEYIMEML